VCFAESRTRDPDLAQDIAQETLMAVIQALRNGQLRDAENLPGFVFGVARNVIGTALRNPMRNRAESIDAAPAAGTGCVC
jgi:DNA-directed RNA polymerase specialized sigma24 family protein